MHESRSSPLHILGWLRWFIPGIMVVLGLFYAVGDHLALGMRPLEAHALHGVIVLGIVGPALVWLVLSWAVRAATWHSRTRDASAQEELDRLARQLRGLLVETFDIQEQERKRIAQDIHDGVTQLIIGVLYETQAARESLSGNPQYADEKLQAAQDLLNRVALETRRAIYDLRPPILDASGLVSALKEYTQHFQEQTQICCVVHVDGVPVRLSPESEVAVYRIAQEALNNVQAHAGAQNVRLTLDFQPHGLTVAIKDDGRGFDHDVVLREKRGRLGLIGMRERAQSIGGFLQVETQPGLGAQVFVHVPISNRAVLREGAQHEQDPRPGCG